MLHNNPRYDSYGRREVSDYTAGYRCDGRCGRAVTLAHVGTYGRTWTFTREGRSYCPGCTPVCNPVHECPPAPPAPKHECPKPPAPPKLTEADVLGNAPGAVVTYWHSDEKRARRWRVRWANLYFRAGGISILKFPADGTIPKIHDIEWGDIISLASEGHRP